MIICQRYNVPYLEILVTKKNAHHGHILLKEDAWHLTLQIDELFTQKIGHPETTSPPGVVEATI